MQESTARQARLLKVMQTLADYVRSDAALDALLAASLEISGGVAAGIFAAGQRYLAGDWNRISAESENWILELAENADGSLLLNRDEDDFAPLSAGLSDAVDFVVVIPLRSGGGRHVAGAFVLGFEANAPDEAIRADLYLLAGQVALVLVSMEFDWLQRRYQRLGSMMANIPEPILLLDRDNTVCELNPAAVEVFRIEEQDIIGRQIQEVLNDEIDLLRYLDTLPRKTSPRD
ncbi:MAG TPA: PAS domain-containing protein, partial [Aggregatilineales bacterium]|nr:PAS domain-containing protein [Aggregatilineales bacterium]